MFRSLGLPLPSINAVRSSIFPEGTRVTGLARQGLRRNAVILSQKQVIAGKGLHGRRPGVSSYWMTEAFSVVLRGFWERVLKLRPTMLATSDFDTPISAAMASRIRTMGWPN